MVSMVAGRGRGRGWRYAAALLIGICGQVASEPARAESAGSGLHVITVEGMSFSPRVLEVRAGDTVEWRNRDIVPHTVAADKQTFQSPVIEAGGTWKHTVREKGEYHYFCTLHPTMKARLVVR